MSKKATIKTGGSYSYHCLQCGHTVLSDDKQVVKSARALHKVRYFYDLEGKRIEIPKCRMIETGLTAGGMRKYARPSIAEFLAKKEGAK